MITTLCFVIVVGTLLALLVQKSGAATKKTAALMALALLMALTPLALTGCLNLDDTQSPEQRNKQSTDVEKTSSPPGHQAKSQRDTDKQLLIVHFIDVGQADAMLLQFPEGQTMLIDGGNYKDGDFVVEYIHEQGIAHLDYIIGTHPHHDHIGGLIKVVNAIPIGKIYMPQVAHNTNTYRDLLLAIKDKNLKVTPAKAGQTLDVGAGVQAAILSPRQQDYTQINDYSVVLKVTHDQVNFLFTGDAEAVAEEQMLKAGYDLKADVLKVAHHGSNTSTTNDFLAAVAPNDAVITVGDKNDYGHPHQKILERLQKAGVKIWRTDQHGTVIAYSNGQTVSFNQQPAKPQSKATNIPNTSTNAVTNSQGVEITDIDLVAEVVTITNKGNTAVDLTNWQLVSVKGDQRFDFAPGTTLPPGGVLKVVSGAKAQPAPNTILWTKEYIWHNDGDPGVLYDDTGQIISQYPR